MRKLGFLIIGLMLLTGNLYAHPDNFDIFGVDAKTQGKIYLSCSKLIDEYLKIPSVSFNKKMLIDKYKIEQKIIAKVKKIDDIETAKISEIYYPSDKKAYATLDLVKKKEIYRIPKSLKKETKQSVQKSQGVKELFAVWNDYENKSFDLMRKNQMNSAARSCPVIHCTLGFDKKELKETLPKIRKGVAKYKRSLIEIIKNSPDDEERGKAIFILAHDDNYQEQARLLIELTDDPSDLVRNNVMRVLGAIVAQYKVEDLDIKRIIHALNYPYVTDRNKAAYVLFGIVKKEPNSHQIVIHQAGKTLLELLKLKQPNNHDFAYQILKEISHKNYSDRDYKSWERWLVSQQNSFS